MNVGPITFSVGANALVGVKSWRLLRSFASFDNPQNDCGSFAAPTQVGADNLASPAMDMVPSVGCYQYSLQTTDNVGGVSVSNLSAITRVTP
jgi:hypothetical protein